MMGWDGSCTVQCSDVFLLTRIDFVCGAPLFWKLANFIGVTRYLGYNLLPGHACYLVGYCLLILEIINVDNRCNRHAVIHWMGWWWGWISRIRGEPRRRRSSSLASLANCWPRTIWLAMENVFSFRARAGEDYYNSLRKCNFGLHTHLVRVFGFLWLNRLGRQIRLRTPLQSRNLYPRARRLHIFLINWSLHSLAEILQDRQDGSRCEDTPEDREEWVYEIASLLQRLCKLQPANSSLVIRKSSNTTAKHLQILTDTLDLRFMDGVFSSWHLLVCIASVTLKLGVTSPRWIHVLTSS